MKKNIGLAIGIMAAAMGLLSGCSKASETAAPTTGSASGNTTAAATKEQTETPKSDYPKSKIELIIPQGVGGGSDLIARVLAAQVEKDLGVPVVCTNVEGGSTSLGLQQLADSEPDGYTIAMTMTNLATLKSLGYSELTYEDFTSVCGANFDAPTVMIRSNDERFTDLQGVVEFAKAHPGELSWGTGAAGGMWHMAILKFCKVAGIEVNVVPNAGGGTGVGLTLANGDIDVAVFSPVDCISQIDSGEIIPIAALTDTRMESYSDVPTSVELGWDCSVYSTRGFIAPKGTPEDVIAVLEASFKKAVESEEFKEFIKNQQSNIKWRDAKEYEEWMKEEVDTYVPILEEAGLAK